ncbi:MAG: PP2C family protein-serine/threonine phosphatase [Planctomycetota bacterium]
MNTSGSQKLPVLMQLVGAISRARTPHEVLRAFSTGIRQIETQDAYISLSTRDVPAGSYRITRLMLDVQHEEMDVANPWDRPPAEVHAGGFLGELIRQAYPELIHNLDLRDDPVLGDALADFGSVMAIPLFDDGEPLNWAIMLRRDPVGYSVEDLEDSILRANLVGLSVRNVLTAQRLREAMGHISREVDQIARIQKALLPSELPDVPGVQLGASIATFDVAGGDIYDVIQHEPSSNPLDPWFLYIADGSGHGPAAATVVAMLNAIMGTLPDSMTSPGERLSKANGHLYARRLDGRFVTAILARFDPRTRELTWARAGHNPALVMSRHGGSDLEIRHLDEIGGVPLGICADVTYEEQTVQLALGDTLVLYTDGITEASSSKGEYFVIEGIDTSLKTCTGMPACVIDHITNALEVHQGSVRPDDDQTLLVMRVDE